MPIIISFRKFYNCSTFFVDVFKKTIDLNLKDRIESLQERIIELQENRYEAPVTRSKKSKLVPSKSHLRKLAYPDYRVVDSLTSGQIILSDEYCSVYIGDLPSFDIIQLNLVDGRKKQYITFPDVITRITSTEISDLTAITGPNLEHIERALNSLKDKLTFNNGIVLYNGNLMDFQSETNHLLAMLSIREDVLLTSVKPVFDDFRILKKDIALYNEPIKNLDLQKIFLNLQISKGGNILILNYDNFLFYPLLKTEIVTDFNGYNGELKISPPTNILIAQEDIDRICALTKNSIDLTLGLMPKAFVPREGQINWDCAIL